nr:FimV/HubP family polar landmark protein [uncultured Halomonas sp.]
MKRTLPLIVATTLVVASPGLQALDLDEMQVQSRLDEPLRARIPLIDLQGIDSSRLRVQLANKAEFQEAGLPRADLIDDLHLTVNREGGDPVLLLSTDQAVSEPYLELLLTLEWPEGKRQHQVNVLLDPPGYANSPSSLNVGLTRTTATLAAASIPKLLASSGRSNSDEAVTTIEEHPRQLQARAGDALSILADRARRGKNATLEQAMLALLTSNPGAFFRNNINALRTGSVLNMPTGEEMSAFDVNQARRQVHEQNEAWQTRHVRPVEVGGLNETLLKEISVNAELVGNDVQKSDDTSASKENEYLTSSSDGKLNRSDTSSLNIAFKQHEARLGEVEAALKTLVTMRQEQKKMDVEIASLRDGLAELHKEFTQTFQELPLSTSEASNTERNATNADNNHSFVEKHKESNSWLEVTGYLIIVVGVVTFTLLALLFHRRRQQDAEMRNETVEPPSFGSDENEIDSELMIKEQVSLSTSVSQSATQGLNTVSDNGAIAKPTMEPGTCPNTDSGLAWFEHYSENVSHNNTERSQPFKSMETGSAESIHQVENERYNKANGAQDEIGRIMDYEPPLLEATSYQKSQKWKPKDNYALDLGNVASTGKNDSYFGQVPGSDEEWEVEEVAFESLKPHDRSSSTDTFKR